MPFKHSILVAYTSTTPSLTTLYNIKRFKVKYIFKFYHNFILIICGPGSSVGIATAYGLDGPGIESRWGRDFPHQSRPALRPTQPPVQWVPRLSRGLGAAGA